MNKAKAKSAKNGKRFLRERLIDVEQAFVAELKRHQDAITHSGTLGDATEDAWIDLLQRYLPTRYRVAKAFAVDHLGNTTDQIDCLIYDTHFTPALFGKDKHLYVPAEAVYATFEVKPSITAADLNYAAKKIASLRALQRTSVALTSHLGISAPKPLLPIIGGLFGMKAKWKDGLGKAFLTKVTTLKGNKKIDFVLTAESGFCDCLEAGCTPTIVSGPGSLIRGLFHLLSALRNKASVTNLAVNGLKLAGLLKIMDGLPANSHFNFILIQIGANDIIQLTQMSDIEKGIGQVLTRAKTMGDKVIVLHSGNIGESLFWPWYLRSLYSHRSFATRDIYMRVASSTGASYVDLIDSNASKLLRENPYEYYAGDLLHLSDAGYGLWFDEIKKKL